MNEKEASQFEDALNEIQNKITEIARLKAIIAELYDALDGVYGPGAWDLRKRAREAFRD